MTGTIEPKRAMPYRVVLLAALAAWAPSAASHADTAQPAGQSPTPVETVTVTAQKRKQKLQDVPISITVLDSKALQRLNVQTSDELAQYVPGLEIALPAGKGNQPLIAIRGIGLNDTNTNNVGPNGVYVDDVYQATPAGQTFQTFDLSRVEVLKGPQGTLYGRNTTGGAIDYVTNKPTDQFSASEDVQYGSWSTATTDTVVNGQLFPGIDGRAVIDYDYSDGYFKDLTDHNFTNGANDLAYRGELLVDRIDNLDLLFNFHGGYVNRRPDEYRSVGTLDGPFGPGCANPMILANQCTDLFGYKSPPGFYSGFYNRDEPLRINALGGSARADYHLDGITITSLTAIETSHKNHEEDSDAAPSELLEINYGVRSTDITQEFRIAGGGSAYHWLAGLYGLDEHLNQDQPITLLNGIDQVLGFPVGGLAERARTINGQFTESVAAFGQGDYEIFPDARITLGGRLTYEHKTFDAFSEASFETSSQVYPPETPLYNISENLSDRAASWHVGFDYKVKPNVLAYVTASTGFKSGGFNGGFLANDVPEALAQLQPIKPEYITALEAGLKMDFFNQRLRFNAAVYDYTYHDLQIYNLIVSPLSTTGSQSLALPLTVLTNAPRAFIRGAEFEFDATPVEHLTTSISLSFLDARLGQFVTGQGTTDLQNDTGNQLPNAPKFNAVLGADYALPLARGDVVELSVSGTYRAHQFFESNNNPLVAQNGYWLLDARLSWTSPNKRWDVAVLGKNLTGQEYLNFSNDLTSGLGLLEEIVGAPRYVGGEVTYRY